MLGINAGNFHNLKLHPLEVLNQSGLGREGS